MQARPVISGACALMPQSFDSATLVGMATLITGSCLCGGVRFEIARAVGPFELCHCGRCRKASGSAFAAMITVRTDDFRLLEGQHLLARYDAPILEGPPAYRRSFCCRCGSPVPAPDAGVDSIEIPAGLFDYDPQIRPDKHIYVELEPPWFSIADDIPRLTKGMLVEWRRLHRSPTGS